MNQESFLVASGFPLPTFEPLVVAEGIGVEGAGYLCASLRTLTP
jgi:hypothetical protein